MGHKKFKLFNHLCQIHEYFRISKYCKNIKFDKVWGYQNEVRQNSKVNHLCWTDEIFRISKNKEKIKFDKIWGYQNEGIPLKRERQNSKLNHSPWTDKIFRIGKYDFFTLLSLQNFDTSLQISHLSADLTKSLCGQKRK